ncbi:hypothetical protein D9757_010145 [Collybiopsis confluens]|uniref:O-methyltransferase C-terminal domain-containing protein n=1 Tax=Collybiopsis confluens TaxID=2823264 RepID=A0A8H5GT17_9AGAR|nr:hypothetical protein D9757_010145 [Collybiopsis confluens]
MAKIFPARFLSLGGFNEFELLAFLAECSLGENLFRSVLPIQYSKPLFFLFGSYSDCSNWEVTSNVPLHPASATLVDDAEFRAHLDLVMHEGRMAIPFFPELVSRRFTASESLPAPPSAFSIYSDGQPFYEWLHSPSQTDRNLNFNIAMRGMANTEGIAFLPMDYPFHSLPTEKPIVDVGGGIGTLPMLLLPTLPRHSFLVQDLEPVVKQAHAAPNDSIKQWMAEGKIKFSVQDCFSPQPPEVDGAVFILKNMIHNYSEPKALEILHNLRRKNPFKLLLIDRLVIPQIQSVDSSARLSGSSQRAATMYDLVMASLHGGKNRTLEEWENLLQRADFRLEKIYPLRASTGQAVMEAICA